MINACKKVTLHHNKQALHAVRWIQAAKEIKLHQEKAETAETHQQPQIIAQKRQEEANKHKGCLPLMMEIFPPLLFPSNFDTGQELAIGHADVHSSAETRRCSDGGTHRITPAGFEGR